MRQRLAVILMNHHRHGSVNRQLPEIGDETVADESVLIGMHFQDDGRLQGFRHLNDQPGKLSGGDVEGTDAELILLRHLQ